jgi:geranylgeranyl reductase
VRRALGLPSPRECFAGEYNVPGITLGPLRVECDPPGLASGYFWVFPHRSYTSIGAVAPKHLIPPAALRQYLGRRIETLGVARAGAPFEGATLEVDYRGLHFPGGVHLAGDAAGLASALTAEGIYPALVSGEEVARTLLEPRFPARRTAHWLRTKRRHDGLARFLEGPARRALALGVLARAARIGPLQRPLARWFLQP